MTAPRKKSGERRNTRREVIEKVLRAKALVDQGESIERACEKVDVATNAYRRWASRNFKFPGVDIDMGSVSAASLPPRPKGGKGGKRVPKPVDMDNIESIAKRVTKINRLLNDVKAMMQERVRLRARLMHLLKG